MTHFPKLNWKMEKKKNFSSQQLIGTSLREQQTWLIFLVVCCVLLLTFLIKWNRQKRSSNAAKFHSVFLLFRYLLHRKWLRTDRDREREREKTMKMAKKWMNRMGRNVNVCRNPLEYCVVGTFSAVLYARACISSNYSCQFEM